MCSKCREALKWYEDAKAPLWKQYRDAEAPLLKQYEDAIAKNHPEVKV